MLIVRKEKDEVRRYVLRDNFVVEVITTKTKWGLEHEFWLYNEEYGIKGFMFGLTDIQEWEEPLYIDTDETYGLIENYKADFMED